MKYHGFDHASACEIAARACSEIGGADKLDTLMSEAEARGGSAHADVLAAIERMEA
jgi:hypothetical protein